MYAIYNEDTGQILRYVDCSPNSISSQCIETKDRFIPFDGDYTLDLVVESGVVVALPNRPSWHHIFDYTAKQWVDPRTPETEWPLIRAERDRRLLVCDWTQLPDVPIATKEAWAVYRQALRDVTLQPDPFNIVWPETP